MPSFSPFTVRVPATTANLGPGFDCLGMALDLWNEVRVSPGDDGIEVIVQGEGGGRLPSDASNLMARAAARLFHEVGVDMPALRLEACNAIPLARGLGSSASATVAGLVLANCVMDGRLSNDVLLDLATEIEGHPDNAAPAMWGGCCLVIEADGRLLVRPVPVPDDLACVLFIPEFTMPTKKARAVLPRRVLRADAVFNASRAALLVRALTLGEWGDLREATRDRLHQPYRAALFPAMELLLEAALEAGASGAFLSGAGSTLVAFARQDAVQSVGAAFAAEARSQDVPGSVRVARPSPRGAYLARES